MQPLWKKVWKLFKNLNIDLPYDPAVPLLRIYWKEFDSGYSRGTCTPLFIAALFIIAKLLKVMETAKMPHYWRRDQENVVIIHNGILLGHEEEWNLIIHK
jgi:hypothetical protein